MPLKHDKKFFFKLAAFCIFLFCTSSFAAEELIIEPDAGRSPLLNAIQDAKSSINLVMYGFTDNQLLNALIKAHQNGKKVHILLEPHPYKADDENNHAISRLQDAQIDLQASNPDFQLTHQKSFVMDNHRTMIMTFNLTHSAFKNERNFALVTDDPNVAHEVNAVFQSDWDRKKIQPHSANLIWSPGQSQRAILEFIQSAHQQIEIYAQDLTDYKIIGALAKAAREGKEVMILLSIPKEDHHHTNKKIAFLERAGVQVHFSHDWIIHAKVIIIDNEKALLGSTNFTYPSMQFNRELSIITHDKKVVEQLENTFRHDFT